MAYNLTYTITYQVLVVEMIYDVVVSMVSVYQADLGSTTTHCQMQVGSFEKHFYTASAKANVLQYRSYP